ncbi:MAG: hypothetical protein LBG88_03310 [Christensenellaceae bacterium]|jgi:DNA segregation ATPase FtsK/SpoIIIE-like protein|nr:hypothetical protein [Christensenellaceae bacterium]
MLGETTGILRDKQKKKKLNVGKWNNVGLILCFLSVFFALMTGFQWPRFLSRGMYGLFGVYTYAILFFTFFVGISMKFSHRYAVNKRYIVCSLVLLISSFTAIHLSMTNRQLGTMTFEQYLTHGFSHVTPGGAIFSIPSFVLWNIFAGVVGASIVLGATFITSAAFMTSFIITRQGENKVIRKKPQAAKRVATTTAEETYKKDYVDLSAQVEQKYQELLQKQSRNTMNVQKSALGLDKLPPKQITTAVYDAAVPLSQLSPSPGFIGDEITNMSTQAATNFAKGLTYDAPKYADELTNTWTPPTNSHVFDTPTTVGNSPNVESLLTEYAIEDQKHEVSYQPTTRARQPKAPSVAPGQTSFDTVMSDAKPKKAYKPARYNRPNISLINTESTDLSEFQIDAELKKGMLDAKLKEFSVNAKVSSFTVAPAITRFEIMLGLGTRANDVYRLEPDFQVILGTEQIRMENVQGKNAIGIEVPNKTIGKVSIRDILMSKEWTGSKSPLTIALGKNISDEIIVGDIGTMPHLLIAGSTGSGKSVCINTILTSLVYRADPADVKLLLVDMKLVELGMYNEIPHMLIPRSIGEVQHAINALKWMQEEMRRRYKVLQSHGLKHVSQYQALPAYTSGQLERMPYILMVIDEAADLIYTGKREVEDAVKQLAALGRASGIHLILATQRPSVDVITAVIKANMPVRIGFKTVSRGDSQTIVNEVGCEKLVGRGDMLFSKEGHIQRIQGAFIEDEEARRVMNYIRENNKCEFDSDVEDYILNGPPEQQKSMAYGFGDGPSAARNQDPMFLAILRWLVREDNVKRQASIASIQRKFSLGFGRAGRIIDQMAEAGYVSEDNGAKGRTVLITREEVDNLFGSE